MRMKAAAEIWRQSFCRLSAVTIAEADPGARKPVWRSARSDGAHLVDRGLDARDPAARLDEDARGCGAGRSCRRKDLHRNVDLVVLVLAEGAPLLRHQADDAVGRAADE